MYSRGAGKSGKYSWIPSAPSIYSSSYVLVQLWEHWRGREFRSIVKTTASHHAYRFAHISWQRLLYVVLPSGGEQPETPSRHTLVISKALQKIWTEISAERLVVGEAMKELLRRKRGAVDDDED